MALVLVISMSSCQSRTISAKENQPLRVKTETIKESDQMNTLNYVGVVEDNSSVALSFSGIGTIERIFVTEGQHVSRGQLVARLNPTSAKNMYDAAESSLKQAKDAYARIKSIHDNGSLPEIQMVEMETKLQQAQSAFNIAHKNLEDCSLYSPISGIVGRKNAEAGENTIVGKQVVTICDISSVKVRFSVPESEIALIAANCESTIAVSAVGDRKFSGKELEKSVLANPVSHTYPVHITISNPDKELLPGMVCKVGISLGERAQCIVIPIDAVRSASNGLSFVWLVKDGFVKRSFITTGEARGNGVEIRSGLTAGDSIITRGYQKISEGDKISVK